MATPRSNKPPVMGRLVGRHPYDADDPGRRAHEITRDVIRADDRLGVAHREAAAEPAPDAVPDAGSVGLLGEPRLGDETSALGAGAPGQGVANDYDDPPSQRRIGDGLSADSLNFQGRPDTSLTGGGDTTASGGGSGL